MGEKTHIVALARSSSRRKAQGKGHVSFPYRRLFRPALALQAASATPRLALAMPAVVTLPATLLINHRVTATLWAKIARDAQMAQA